ncbi:MAG: hypothetical protein L6V86_03250 [Treponema sp.]|nr:MAG: hypothetical protein L6V86_03250 [Treponema sp.]
MEFIDYYSALDYMPELTDFTAEGNKFFAIVNDTTHSGQILQAPDYVPSIDVEDRTTSKVEKYRSVSGNIAALKRFGEWLEYLKETDVTTTQGLYLSPTTESELLKDLSWTLSRQNSLKATILTTIIRCFL